MLMTVLVNKEEMVLPWMFYVFGYLDEQNLLIANTESMDEVEEFCIEETTKLLSSGVATLNEIKTYADLPFFTLRQPLKEELFLKCQEKICGKLKVCWSVEDAKEYSEKEPKISFQNTRVFYIFGLLQSKKVISVADDSMESIQTICLEIADNWSKSIDIRNSEEEGYPTAYAERVLLEKYGVKCK
ncbi:hypothetical protein CN918_28545 [Priestia megaterium]|nr:hypothetical protein CN918_28545 [Priestia megaterium]